MNWRDAISAEMREQDEVWDDIQASTLDDSQLDKEFDGGYGGEEGAPFTVWTARRVYFPTCYDGSEWVSSVSRYPDGKPTCHVGG